MSQRKETPPSMSNWSEIIANNMTQRRKSAQITKMGVLAKCVSWMARGVAERSSPIWKWSRPMRGQGQRPWGEVGNSFNAHGHATPKLQQEKAIQSSAGKGHTVEGKVLVRSEEWPADTTIASQQTLHQPFLQRHHQKNQLILSPHHLQSPRTGRAAKLSVRCICILWWCTFGGYPVLSPNSMSKINSRLDRVTLYNSSLFLLYLCGIFQVLNKVLSWLIVNKDEVVRGMTWLLRLFFLPSVVSKCTVISVYCNCAFSCRPWKVAIFRMETV